MDFIRLKKDTERNTIFSIFNAKTKLIAGTDRSVEQFV